MCVCTYTASSTRKETSRRRGNLSKNIELLSPKMRRKNSLEITTNISLNLDQDDAS